MQKTAWYCWMLMAAPLVAQIDDRLWLTRSGGALGGPTGVLEVDRTGQVVGTWPGVTAGSSGVAKDPFTGVVWVCDDAYPNGGGVAPGALRQYRKGVGLIGTYPAPGIRGVAVLSNGDLAGLFSGGFFSTGSVRILSWNQTNALGPPIPLGLGATTILPGANGACWALSLTGQNVFRVDGAVAQPVPLMLVGAPPASICLEPGGGILVSHLGSPVVQRVNAAGTVVGLLTLPEPPIRLAVDGDQTLFALGVSGVLHRVRRTSGVWVESIALGTGPFGALICDRTGEVWVEDQGASVLRRVGFNGASLSTVTLPFATFTSGDASGLGWASGVQPTSDVDGDGVITQTEISRGSDPLDGVSVPPALVQVGGFFGIIPMMIDAPGHSAERYILLPSLSGANPPTPMGIDGYSAPRFELKVGDDVLTLGLLSVPETAPFFPGMPDGNLDGTGRAFAAIDLRTLGAIPANFALIYCCALVIDGTGRVVASTNPVCFDASGTPCP